VSQASLDQERVKFELAQANYTRSRNLANGTISKQEVDEQQTTFLAARGALVGAEGAVKGDQAEIQRLETLVSFSKITAPFAGVISARNYDVGALLSSTTSGDNKEMFRIAQTDVLRAVVDVPQSYYDQVTVGSAANFTVRNYPNKPFAGKIARTSGAVDPQTRTVRVEADFDNHDGRLLPGMYGQVQLTLAHKEMPLVIPTSALVFGSQGMRVAVIRSDGRLEFARIGLGRDFGTEVEVLSGLKGDEQLVGNPGERLSEGLAVRVAAPARAAIAEAKLLPDSSKVVAAGK
jgi:RND family efflux transporter MFP subunit